MTTTTKKTELATAFRAGKIAIPEEFSTSLGITDETLLRITLEDGKLTIAPVDGGEPGEGSSWFRDLYDYYAPVREEILAQGISEEEVNAVIDAAVAEVRAEQRAKLG